MKTIRTILISISLAAFSCTEMKESKDLLSRIDVKVSSESFKISLSDVANYSLFLLPTNDSLVIGEINRIHNSSDFIYLSDVSGVYKFTYDGKLINKINKQGDGPDEYLNVSDFVIDNNSNNIWILSRSMQTLFQYSWDGKLLKKIKVDLWPQSMCMVDNNILLYTGNELNKENKQLHLLDVVTGAIVRTYKPIEEGKSEYLHVKGTNFFQIMPDNSCRFIQLFNDTIYRITSEKINQEIAVNWDGHNIPEDYYKKGFQNMMDFFQDFHRKSIYAYGINFFVETSTSYWISFYYKKKCFCSIVQKDGGVCQSFDQITIDAIGDYVIDLLDSSIFIQDDGCIVIPVDAMDVKEYLEDKERKNSNIPNDSNPYLLIINPNQ